MKEALSSSSPGARGPCFYLLEGDVFSIGGGELRAIKRAKLNHSLHSLCSTHWGAARAEVRSYRNEEVSNTRRSRRSDERDARLLN